ncbi:hypothetical protein SAMN06298216_2629 [Spirosomataceae bacterium TFI 002]|nr:hypothetical protein SAMN06298216_2629 [Spirosomataceae bacterium TFI 002]
MKSFLQIILLITLSIGVKYAKAQELFLSNEIEKSLKFLPSDKKAIFYNIIGTNRDFSETDLEIKLPEGWKLLTATTIDNLLLGEHKEPFFTFQVSDRAKSGNHVIYILLKEKGEVVSTFQIETTVKEVRSIEVIALERPTFVEEKPVESIKYLVRNNGNTEEKVLLSSGGKIVGDADIVLLAGQSRQVVVAYNLPIGLGSITKVSFDLGASIRNELKPFGLTFSVPYLTTNTKKSDPYHRFPIQVGILSNSLWSSLEKVSAFQFDIRGRGFLDLNKKHELTFIAKGPDRFNLPRFGNIDQYFVSYKSDIGRIAVGGNSFNVSQLIEANRFAKGIEIGKKIGKWDVSAIYERPRFFNDIKSGAGIKSEYRIDGEKILKLNVFNKKHNYNSQWLSTNFASAGLAINKQKLQLESEASLSVTNNKVSTGVFNNFYLNLDKLKVSSNFIYAGKEFHGYYNNSIFAYNDISYKLAPKLQVSAFQSLSQINPSLDTFYYLVAPYSHNNGVELAFKPSSKHTFRVNVNKGGREDRMEVKKYHYKEDLFRYFYRGDFSKFSIRFDGDFGKVENLLEVADERKKTNQIRNKLNLIYKPVNNINIGGFGEYLETTRFSTTTNQSKFLFYGVQSNVSLKNNLDMSLFYRNSYAPDELFQNQSFFDFSTSYRVKQHEFSIVSSYAFTPQPVAEKNLFVSLKYTLHINAPLKKKKNLGHLNGRVLGIQKSGVVLNLNGEKVMTDSTGKFAFYDLEPGRYMVGVNKSSLDFGNIVSGDGPLFVNVEANTTAGMNLKVVKSGSVQGKVIAYDKEEDATEYLPNIIVEIFNKDFSRLTSTNKFGEFVFSEIEEGDYDIRIKSVDLGKKYKIENPSAKLIVEQGKEALFTFLLEPKKRKIQFQKETIILSDSKGK